MRQETPSKWLQGLLSERAQSTSQSSLVEDSCELEVPKLGEECALNIALFSERIW